MLSWLIQLRILTCSPVPHDLEQDDHSVQVFHFASATYPHQILVKPMLVLRTHSCLQYVSQFKNRVICLKVNRTKLN